MGLIQTGVDEEGDTTAKGGDATADEGTPQEGGIARLLIDHCWDDCFAAGTS